MKEICLALARFRENKKEAISKNLINLAEGLTIKGYPVATYTPTKFKTLHPIRQYYCRKNTIYSSLPEGFKNLYQICRAINKKQNLYSVINFHIATPIELLILFMLLNRRTREKTKVSIWQSYLSFLELKDNYRYFSKNFTKYVHIILLNSFVTAIFYRLFLSKFSKTIVHSTYLCDKLMDLAVPDIAFVQNGVIPEETIIPERKMRQKFVFLYIGHAKVSKGIEYLIKLIAILHQRDNLNFHLVISFSGFGDEQYIKRLIDDYRIESRVLFKPEINVIQEMADADMCLLPLPTCIGTSLSPNVIVEALSIGLPIAVPRYPELNGLIQFGFNAIELKLYDLEYSAERIELAAKDGDFLETIKKNQRKQFKQCLSLEKFIDGYIRELRSA